MTLTTLRGWYSDAFISRSSVPSCLEGLADGSTDVRMGCWGIAYVYVRRIAEGGGKISPVTGGKRRALATFWRPWLSLWRACKMPSLANCGG